ncbi:catechol 2,3-dioxygenase-like lactoylglutathione lyase family enzyme [Xanthomonas campestris]|uniref:hypothetical protein n=1 Tax=Xanthomonas TaxID=338 RepID=UPI0019D2EB9F|nr:MULTISPECIES: hypothetical protein [Xanthomonas]NIJ91527.1 catechol 2,3-dioxygenase-like lactoylglutathione lyase family enzyme [Xanthomonas euroxanthea]
MLDHIFLTVTDTTRSIAFYTAALVPLGIVDRLDYDGRQGASRPPGPERLRRAGGVFYESWQHGHE